MTAVSSSSPLSDELYTNYREVFLGWARRKWSGYSDDDIIDIFHDSLMVYLKYRSEGKVDQCKPQTFIIAVGNRKFHKKYQKTGKEPILEMPVLPDVPEEEVFVPQTLVRKAIDQLSEKCREILICKYFYGFSMRTIKEEINATSEGSVRTQKKRCMKKLKDIIEEIIEN